MTGHTHGPGSVQQIEDSNAYHVLCNSEPVGHLIHHTDLQLWTGDWWPLTADSFTLVDPSGIYVALRVLGGHRTRNGVGPTCP